eukprot:TRINITY_DN5750_c0_g1_i4.p1 TRINITY_DN5750_c0_g1~~TRINITY_DN5750_c0_g1_i4.p1  ORF type:complete len:236 (-),score=17.78 TRINITY_DN5750_c0_g1_i4:67-774(-)
MCIRDSFKNLPEKYRTKVPTALLAYMIALLVTRLKLSGPEALYDLIWACNVGLIVAIYGMYTNNSVLVGSSMVLISIDQVLWYIDILGYLFTKKFPIGVAKYLTWEGQPFIKKVFSMHHIWFIPLLLKILKNSGGLSNSSFLMSVKLSLLLSVIARLTTPKMIKSSHGETYLNINLSWECWKDIKLKFLHLCNDMPMYMTVPFNNTLWNSGNFVFFLLLKKLLKVLNSVDGKSLK